MVMVMGMNLEFGNKSMSVDITVITITITMTIIIMYRCINRNNRDMYPYSNLHNHHNQQSTTIYSVYYSKYHQNIKNNII